MAGHYVDTSNRVRIKGHKASVLRFFSISVAYMIVWILITSRLGFYSKQFGPQILLQLNLSFYLPSIPILIISGRVEKLLDAKFGQAMSMLLRLNTGLLGCFAICASFPFYPVTRAALLASISVLGILSSVAFSTSYQLVSWFRSADTIALGIGCVGSGPVVLLIQVAFNCGPHPEKWQVIVMFEIAAAIVLCGLLSSLSLFKQYWPIFTGEHSSADVEQRLLINTTSPPELESDIVSATPTPLATTLSSVFFLSPDPYGGLVLTLDETELSMLRELEDSKPPLLQSRPIISNRRGKLATSLSFDRRRSHTGLQHYHSYHADWDREGSVSRSAPKPHQGFLATVFNAEPLPMQPFSGLHEIHSDLHLLPSDSTSQDLNLELNGSRPNSQLELNSSRPNSRTPFQAQLLANDVVLSCLSEDHSVSGAGTREGLPRIVGRDAEKEVSLTTESESSSMLDETLETIKGIWVVMLVFFTSNTVLYLAFPFFTYIPTSSWLGDSLPTYLFFSRMFADVVGRVLPRAKVLMARHAGVLVILACTMVVGVGGLLGYIRMPARLRNDALPLTAVIFLWFSAGYINTCANILAPNSVRPALVPRAMAIMALTFQVAHFMGLLAAIGLAVAMFGGAHEGI